MTKIQLQFPIEVGGKSISSVTVRRPKGKDMVALGDHLSALSRFDGDTPGAVPDAAAFRAMVASVAALADLSEEEAGELDLADLIEIANHGFAHLGNLKGRGTPKAGAKQ